MRTTYSILCLVALVGGSRLHAQLPNQLASNHVLELDGTNSWVELPPDIFTNLTEATVEGWVKWGRLASWSRFFDFGHDAVGQEIDITQEAESDRLNVELGTPTGDFRKIVVPAALRLNEWQHYALVLGKNQTLLYLNGVRVGATDAAGLQLVSRNARAALGHNLWAERPRSLALLDFQGQMDEVRVWKVARTEAQIREVMSRKLTGQEPGLVGLWNFDDPANPGRDASPGAHHGKLRGNAQVVLAPRPSDVAAVPKEMVLALDGTNSYVELPSNIFNELSEATVEAWMKLSRFASQDSTLFSFGAEQGDMFVSTHDDTAMLKFVIYDAAGARHGWRGPNLDIPDAPVAVDIVRTGQWCHVAAVSGKDKMRLYFNGVLLGTANYPGSFAQMRPAVRNYLGKSNWPGNYDFAGEIGEFRVWKVARTQEQIRKTMSQKLTGQEPDLAGLWNFDSATNGVVKDLSPGGHDALLKGNAIVTRSTRPVAVVYPTSFSGRITDSNGKPIAGATVQIMRNGINQLQALTDANGEYVLGGMYAGETYDVSVSKGDLGGWRLGVEGQAQTTHLDIEAGPSTVSGSLLALDGSPHVSAVVQAVAVVPTASGASREEAMATERSDARGDYRFVNLRPGTYRIRSPGPSGYAYLGEGKTLTIESGKPLAGMDLRFAPQKKGNWETYDIARGLADNTEVRKILIEPDGSVWFATRGGVSRFDGQEFVNFTSADGLPDDYVMNMARDTAGNLWFSTFTGIARYDGKKFVKWTATNGVPTRFIDAIYAAPDGKMWFSSGFGDPWVFSFDGQKFAYFTTTNGLTAGVRKMAGGRNGIIWMASQGLLRFDGTNFVNVTAAAGLGDFNVDTPHVAADGKVWFCGVRGAWSYDGTNFVNYTTRDGLGSDDVRCTCSAPDGSIWFGTQGGASRFDGTNFVNFTKEDGLPGNDVIFVTSFPDGTMWFGTLSGGAARYDAGTFASFTTADGLSQNSVFYSLAAPDGTLWFTYGFYNNSPPKAEPPGTMAQSLPASRKRMGFQRRYGTWPRRRQAISGLQPGRD